MSKKQEFIEFIEQLMEKANITEENMSENVLFYWNVLKGPETTEERPLFTENGKLVLGCLKNKPEIVFWKARDIGEELFISSRTVTGAMRKLVTDGYVEKIPGSPSVYTITEQGKNAQIN